jgi:hypothetical protein
MFPPPKLGENSGTLFGKRSAIPKQQKRSCKLRPHPQPEEKAPPGACRCGGRDQFGPVPPYATGPDVLFIAYHASAELGSCGVLGWPTPERIFDLFTEFRARTNGLETRHPLKISIHKDLIAVCKPAIDGGSISADDIKRALAFYTGNSGYLHFCRKVGTARIGLPSTAIDVVTKAEAKHARKILKRLRRKRLAAAERADLAAMHAVTGITSPSPKRATASPVATVASCKG